MAPKASFRWPVLAAYDQDHLTRIALPLGGIGTGTVSLGGRGDLRDWEVVNRPAKGFKPKQTFFALWARPVERRPLPKVSDLREGMPIFPPEGFRPSGGEGVKPSGEGGAVTRALEGILEAPYEGGFGSVEANHGLPRFRKCSFLAAYPFGQVLLSDPDVPLDVRIEAFNPLVPADVESSSLPVAVLRFVLTNKTAKPVDASVCGSLENFIGSDGQSGKPLKNVNEFREAGKLAGIFLRSDGVDPKAEQAGTMALAALSPAKNRTDRTDRTDPTDRTYRRAWANLSWGDSLLDFWDDFGQDGRLEDRDAGGVDAPQASLAVSLRVPARASRAVTFLLAWHFPNRMTWTPAKAPPLVPLLSGGTSPPTLRVDSPPRRARRARRRRGMNAERSQIRPTAERCDENEKACCSGSCQGDPNRIGNYYTTRYQDAWDAAVRTAEALPRLEAATVRFVRAFCESDLPPVVKEAALFNLSTLRSQTCFRTEDGRFYGWEGCGDKNGCCHGTCTHVWNYEQATAFLFGDLARSLRETEFLDATNEAGLMSFRVNLPRGRAQESALAAADGQMGCLMKLYRDWQLSGDDAWLRTLWPKARKALEFCWIPGGWDGDRDGVMEGCQHNTMDVEYFGPNPQMGAWYLGALRAGEEMARHLGDADFAAACRGLFERGSRWMDEHLFNGDYYEHEIRPPANEAGIAPGLRLQMGAKNLADPELQLGAGCLVDQLVGQYMAHVCGLGYLLDRSHVRKTLASIMRFNFKEGLYGHFNHLRSFALNEESAILMATYPRGRRPRRPFPYYNEAMTGFEYTAAVGLLYEGQTALGLKAIRAIRERYDGRKRSPFDEAECGHHYARAMASWAAVLALTGFRYSGVEKAIEFAATPKASQCFWSTGHAWGTCRQRPGKKGTRVELSVLGGVLEISRLSLAGRGSVEMRRPKRIVEGKTAVRLVVTR